MAAGARYLAVALVALLAAGAAVGPARAGEVDDPRAASGPATGWTHRDRALGDPAGFRGGLETSGVSVQAFYNQFFGWRARGGSGGGDGLGASGSYDVFTQLDVEEIAGRPGLTVLAHLKGAYDHSINREVGALSDPVDDADFDEVAYLSELWVEQILWRDRAGLRFGFLEQRTHFDRNEFANNEDRQFSAAFLDGNPVVPLPNGFGLAAWVRPTPWLELAVGVGDADNEPRHLGFHTAFDGPESWTEVLEATVRVAWPGTRLRGHYRVGGFRDGADRIVFGRVDPVTGRGLRRRGHYGWYLSIDQEVWEEPGEAHQGLGVFGRLGFADDDTNRIDSFVSLGATYRGAIPGRGADEVAIGWAYAGLSDRYSAATPGSFRHEHSVEVYYRVEVFPWLFFTPHLQYIASPSGERGARDAVVALMRLRLTL